MKIKGPSSVQRLALSAFLLLIVMVELGTAAKDGDGWVESHDHDVDHGVGDAYYA